MAESSSSNLPVELDNVRKLSEQANKEKYGFHNRTDSKDRTKLKAWHILAIMEHYLHGVGPEKIAKKFKKAPSTVKDIIKCPGGVALRDWLADQIEDPVEFAKSVVKANAMNLTMDWLMALEWAKEARDYDSVARMTKDLNAIAGVQATPPKQEIETKKTIQIVFDGSSLEQEIPEANWEEIIDEEEDDE